MARWAIVIGIDQYWRPDACLKGAVNDALKFSTWVIERAHVPEENVFLLLGPAADRSVPAKSARPTRRGMIDVIDKLAAESRLKGERLFFYYAGHGLSNRRDRGEEQALLPEDFSDRDTQQSFSRSEEHTSELQSLAYLVCRLLLE